MLYDTLMGEVRMFAHTEPPDGWLPCDGRKLRITDYQALFTLIGTQFGGDSITTFSLPDLRGRIPMSVTDSFMVGALAPAAPPGADSEPQPFTAVAYFIAVNGLYPSRP